MLLIDVDGRVRARRHVDFLAIGRRGLIPRRSRRPAHDQHSNWTERVSGRNHTAATRSGAPQVVAAPVPTGDAGMAFVIQNRFACSPLKSGLQAQRFDANPRPRGWRGACPSSSTRRDSYGGKGEWPGACPERATGTRSARGKPGPDHDALRRVSGGGFPATEHHRRTRARRSPGARWARRH